MPKARSKRRTTTTVKRLGRTKKAPAKTKTTKVSHIHFVFHFQFSFIPS